MRADPPESATASFSRQSAGLQGLYRRALETEKSDPNALEELKARFLGEGTAAVQDWFSSIPGKLFDAIQKLPPDLREWQERKFVEMLLVAQDGSLTNQLFRATDHLKGYTGAFAPRGRDTPEFTRRKGLVREVRAQLKKDRQGRFRSEVRGLREALAWVESPGADGVSRINGMPIAEYKRSIQQDLSRLLKQGLGELAYKPDWGDPPSVPPDFKLTAEEERAFPPTNPGEGPSKDNPWYIDITGEVLSREQRILLARGVPREQPSRRDRG